jgi:hypothetical protein
MAVEVRSAPTTHEMMDPQGQNEMATLEEFGKWAVELRNVLYRDKALTEEGFRFIVNHFQALEMAYLRWKRKQGTAGH